MTESLRQFMKGIIDYAGLFPPAKLSLDKAIHNYAKYRKSSDSQMLSRFIIPAARLHELNKYTDLFSRDDPFHFSVLGSKKETVEEFVEEINAVINFCTAFCEAHSGSVSTDMLEVKLPPEVVHSQNVSSLKKLMDDTAEQLQAFRFAPNVIFYEGLFDKNWRDDNEAIIQAIEFHNSEFSSDKNYQFAAYKIRCGGVKKELFPSIEQLAFILNTARRNGVALKGTAGLHHPVRHYSDEVNTEMHGFFNVFGGAMLARANDFDEATLREVLKEEDATQFGFTDEAFFWKSYSVSAERIKSLRESALLSFGSCSFEEPREDLRNLKLT